MNITRNITAFGRGVRNIFEDWGRSLKESYQKPVLTQEAIDTGFVSGLGGIDDDDALYRSMNMLPRDLNPVKYERGVQISQWFYEKDPLYKRMIDIPLDAVTSAGIQIKSDNPKVKEVLEDFWSRPITGFRHKFMGRDGLLKEELISGELNLPLGMNEDGSIAYAFIEPLNIKRVSKVPGNALFDNQIVMKNSQGGEGQVFDVLRPVGPRLFGDVFRHAVNRPVNASRGKPVLFSLLDYVDMHEQSMWNELTRWKLLKAHIWDFEIEGASEEEIKKLENEMKQKQPLQNGAVRVHNERTKIQAVTPSLNAQDGSKMAQLARGFVVSAAGLNDFFMGFGDGINEATAREIMKVVVWMLEHVQRQIIDILEVIFTFALEAAATTNKQTIDGVFTEADLISPDGKSKVFSIIPNQVLKKEFVAEAAALQQNTASMVLAMQNDLLDVKTARSMFVQAVQEVGFEDVEVENIEENLEAEKAEPGVQLDMFGSPDVAQTQDGPTFAEIGRM